MNLFKAAMHPVSFWTSLMQVGALILVMAEIFSGLALMPRWLMMKPSSFPDGTPKTHLFGLSFQRYSQKDTKVSSRLAMSVSEFLVLTTT
jgi:phage protein U